MNLVPWLKGIKWGRTVIAGIVFTAISMVVHNVEAIINMRYYQLPEYFSVWSKLMLPTAGPPPASFFAWSALISLASGIVLAIVYSAVKILLPKGAAIRAASFTILISLILLVFSTLPLLIMVNLPFALILAWFLDGIVAVFLSALAFNRILK